MVMGGAKTNDADLPPKITAEGAVMVLVDGGRGVLSKATKHTRKQGRENVSYLHTSIKNAFVCQCRGRSGEVNGVNMATRVTAGGERSGDKLTMRVVVVESVN